MKTAGTGLFLCCVLLAGCDHTSRPLNETLAPEIPPKPSYVTGEVLVGFRDGVSEQQADAMFVSHGLSWKSYFSKTFAYWVEVEAGDLDAHLVRLTNSPIVSWAKRRGNPHGDADAVYIIVSFNVTATHESAQALIDSIPGLRVSSMNLPPQWGKAAVVQGKELEWIAVLEREPIVEYATVNGFVGGY